MPVLDDMISDIGFIGLKYSIGTALKYWEYVAFKYWDRDRRDIFGIGTALIPSSQVSTSQLLRNPGPDFIVDPVLTFIKAYH